MKQSFKAPEFGASAFNCPHCGAFAHQRFEVAYSAGVGSPQFRFTKDEFASLQVSVCAHCKDLGVWYDESLVFPRQLTAAPAHEDMPQDVASDYQEAREVADLSPRAAAALLRLALQKLLIHLGHDGSLDSGISSLVQKGLDARVQRALDIVRISGNNAVHPGELDLHDDHTTVTTLFDLLNFIVQAMITQPRDIDRLWRTMPTGAREATTKRVRKINKP